MNDSQIKQVFQSMLEGKDLTLMSGTSTKQYYYFIKAYKLVDLDKFLAYCNSHKQEDSITPFHQMLLNILNDHYPPLTYNHPMSEGYPDLPRYVDILKELI